MVCRTNKGSRIHLYDRKKKQSACGYGHGFDVLDDRGNESINCYKCLHIVNGTEWKTWGPRHPRWKNKEFCGHEYQLTGIEDIWPYVSAKCIQCGDTIAIKTIEVNDDRAT